MALTKRDRKYGSGCVTLFALPFAAIGVAALYFVASSIWTWQRMQTWDPVQATVRSVDLLEHDGDDSTTYEVVARYAYEFEGREYVGDRVAISGFADNIGSFHQDLYAELSAARSRNESVTAYADPSNPADATLNRDLRWLLTLFAAIFALLFGGVGFGLLFGLRVGVKKLAQEEQLKERHPNEPWRWREDWASGQIRGSNRATAYFAIGFALFWNLISLPLIFVIPGEVEDGNLLALIGLLFPLVGVGLLVHAVRAWLRLHKFKVSTLILDRTPIELGGRLRGRLRVEAEVPVNGAFTVSLTCKRGKSNSKNSSEQTLWQDERTVPRHHCQINSAQSSIPIDIALPLDQPESNNDAPATITWRLEVSGECPGPDFCSHFDVPVFGVADSVDDSPAASTASDPREEPDREKLGSMGIVLGQLPQGGEAWTFARARHKAVAVGLTLFTAIWSAVTAWLWTSDAPLLFPIVFGAFDLLLIWFMLTLWFAKYRVALTAQMLTVTGNNFGLGGPLEIPRQAIKRVRTVRGMQAGGKLYYDLSIETNHDGNHRVGLTLGDYGVAAWFADHLMYGLRSRFNAQN